LRGSGGSELNLRAPYPVARHPSGPRRGVTISRPLPVSHGCSAYERDHAVRAALASALVLGVAPGRLELWRPSDRSGRRRRTTPSRRRRSHTLDAIDGRVGCDLVLALWPLYVPVAVRIDHRTLLALVEAVSPEQRQISRSVAEPKAECEGSRPCRLCRLGPPSSEVVDGAGAIRNRGEAPRPAAGRSTSSHRRRHKPRVRCWRPVGAAARTIGEATRWDCSG
jgi:hypothetical protein